MPVDARLILPMDINNVCSDSYHKKRIIGPGFLAAPGWLHLQQGQHNLHMRGGIAGLPCCI